MGRWQNGGARTLALVTGSSRTDWGSALALAPVAAYSFALRASSRDALRPFQREHQARRPHRNHCVLILSMRSADASIHSARTRGHER